MEPYNEPPYTARQHQLIGVTSFCLVISTLAVAFRLSARHHFGIKLWWDDYMTVVTLIFSYSPIITTLIGVKLGLGRHAKDVNPNNLERIGLTVWLHQLTWVTTLPMICLSILLLYLRLFPKTWLHKGSYVAAGLTVIWFIAQVIVFICQCTPVQSFWNMKIIGHCIDENKFYAAGCSISMINIIAVFFLPLPIIWKLQISRSKKWSLMLAFCIGVVSCVSSILRLILVLEIDNKDQTWTIATPILWGCLEISLGVVSACIPSLMPLFLVIFGNGRKTRVVPYRNYQSNTIGSSGKKVVNGSKFSHLLSINDPCPLPEALELPNRSQHTLNENDDTRLVPESKPGPSDIYVTNHIDQISTTDQSQVPPLHNEPGDATENTWESRSQASVHV